MLPTTDLKIKEKKTKAASRDSSNLSDELTRERANQREPIVPCDRYIRLAFPESASTSDEGGQPPAAPPRPEDKVQRKRRSSLRRDQQNYVDHMINGAVAGMSLENKEGH